MMSQLSARLPPEYLEAKLLVEGLGSVDVLHGEADGKGSEFHGFAPFYRVLSRWRRSSSRSLRRSSRAGDTES
jgi:hypothetical protein